MSTVDTSKLGERKPKHKHTRPIEKKAAIYFLILLLAGIYVGIGVYYDTHYFPGTRINGYDCGGKEIGEVRDIFTKAVADYKLTIYERYYLTEERTGKELGLSFRDDGTMRRVMNSQYPLAWISAFFKDYDYDDGQIAVSLNEGVFNETFINLDAFDKKYQVGTRNAYSWYNKKTGKYDIIKEVPGNGINKKKFYSYMKKAVLSLSPEVDIARSEAYEQPKYFENSDKIVKSNKNLNKYVSTKVTYEFGDKKYVVNGNVVNKWLSLDKKYHVHLDKNKVKDYVENMADDTDTLGGTREFDSISGNHVTVSGGTYGWLMDRDVEYEHLVDAIKDAKKEKRNPEYRQRARSRNRVDLGDTYVEVDLGSQHMWYFKDGEVLVSSDVVTGCVSKGRATPQGTYYVLYKQTNHTMVGPGYRSFVNYWLPYMNRGIGLHDSSWRGSYGGSIYISNGSHGCVNMPYSAVKSVFYNIEPGCPVCVHY